MTKEKSVADDPSDGPRKRDEIDKVASEACTRSGAFALLITVLLFVLCFSWQERRADQALADYIAARLNLSMFYDELQNDPLWQKYAESNPDANQKPLAQLMKASVVVGQTPPETELSEPVDKPRAVTKPRTADSRSSKASAPTNLTVSAPTNLRVSIANAAYFYELSRIVESWNKLNDSDLLTRGRGTSNYFDFSIAKWANRRGTLMYANNLTSVCTVSEFEIPHKFFKSAQYVPRLNDEAVMNCITLRDLGELARYELPQMSSPLQLGGRIARDVDLSPGSLPKDPYSASLVAEALLFFALVYFSAFAREAVSSGSFPATGTLFGAFSRMRWLLVVFYLALWTPFLGCCAVGLASGRVLLGLAAIPVLLATLSAHRTLIRKSFFESIRPSAFLAAYHKRRTEN
jgi:hypothetical protein